LARVSILWIKVTFLQRLPLCVVKKIIFPPIFLREKMEQVYLQSQNLKLTIQLMMNSLFATKSLTKLLDEDPARSAGFKRTITRLNLTNIGIGAIIGAGIFVLTGLHSHFRSTWVPFVPVFGAIICLLQMFSLPFDTWLRLKVLHRAFIEKFYICILLFSVWFVTGRLPSGSW
jgi:hypothetical protein